jgi:hypothetical protein
MSPRGAIYAVVPRRPERRGLRPMLERTERQAG